VPSRDANVVWALCLKEINPRFGRYRLSVREEEAMARSLRQHGQISPIVVWVRDEAPVLASGFKRLTPGRVLKSIEPRPPRTWRR
jgi:hypothetical protein